MTRVPIEREERIVSTFLVRIVVDANDETWLVLEVKEDGMTNYDDVGSLSVSLRDAIR
jgi:hypothetical protein